MVNVPVGLIALLLLTQASASPRRQAPLDWRGQMTAVVAMAALVFGAIEAGDVGIVDARVLAAMAVAVAAAGAFIATPGPSSAPDGATRPVPFQHRGRDIGFAFMVGHYGMPFVMSVFLQQERGLSALAAGVTVLPMMLIGLSDLQTRQRAPAEVAAVDVNAHRRH